MKHILKPLFSCLIGAALSLGLLPEARAQTFTYTYYPDNATVNSAISTDYAIVGYAGGYYDENDFSRHFTSPSSPTVQIAVGANIINEIDAFNHSMVDGLWRERWLPYSLRQQRSQCLCRKRRRSSFC